MCRECGFSNCPDGCPNHPVALGILDVGLRQDMAAAIKALAQVANLLPDCPLRDLLDDAQDALEDALEGKV